MKFVDMAMSPKEAQTEMGMPSTDASNLPKYPYGLCISFGPDEIEKLGLDCSDCSVGDFLHLHAMAKVTSYSERETEDGVQPRIEMVLAFIDAEDEGEEDEEANKGNVSRLYR